MSTQRYTTERAVGFEHGAVTVPEINAILADIIGPYLDGTPSDAMVVVQANGSARIHFKHTGQRGLSYASLSDFVGSWITWLERGRGLFTADERARGIERFKAWLATHAEAA